jgi:hypothetical protein
VGGEEFDDLFLMKYSIFLFVIAAAVMSASQAFSQEAAAEVATLYQSDFTGSGRPKGWVVCGDARIEASDSALNLKPGSETDSSRNFIVCKFPAVKLEKDDDFIAMKFTLKVNNAPAQDNNIRFGLFDSNGTPLESKTTSREDPALRDDSGFYFRLATHPDSNAGRVSRYYMSLGNGQTAALTSNYGTQQHLGEDNLTGAFLSGHEKDIEMILTRRDQAVHFNVFFNGRLQTQGRIVDAPPTYRFDQAVFSIVHPETSASISKFVIESNGTQLD